MLNSYISKRIVVFQRWLQYWTGSTFWTQGERLLMYRNHGTHGTNHCVRASLGLGLNVLWLKNKTKYVSPSTVYQSCERAAVRSTYKQEDPVAPVPYVYCRSDSSHCIFSMADPVKSSFLIVLIVSVRRMVVERNRPCKIVLSTLVALRGVTDLYPSWGIHEHARMAYHKTCGTEYQQPYGRFNSQTPYYKWNIAQARPMSVSDVPRSLQSWVATTHRSYSQLTFLN